MPRNRIAPKAPSPAAELTVDESLLVDVLALTDGLWTPLRFHDEFRKGASGSIVTRRRRFAREGVQLAGGKTGAERVQVGRTVGRLVRAGLLRRHKTRTKSLAVSLTCDGDEIARSLCGLSTVAEAFCVMTQMHMIGQTDFAIVEGGHPATERQPLIREIFLIAEPQYKNDDEEFSLALSSLHVSLAPALWRGWVSSHYDHAGRVCYHLEDAGWEIGQDEHDADRARMEAVAKAPFSPRALERLQQTYFAELDARKSWNDENARGEISGWPYLSASLPTKGELAALHADQAECKRLDLHCPKCGGQLMTGIIPGTSPREAQCWREECRHRFTITEPVGAAK